MTDQPKPPTTCPECFGNGSIIIAAGIQSPCPHCKGARATRPTSAPADGERTDALYDSAYIAGAKAGYNLGVAEDSDGLERLIASRDGYLSLIRVPKPQQKTAATEPRASDAERARLAAGQAQAAQCNRDNAKAARSRGDGRWAEILEKRAEEDQEAIAALLRSTPPAPDGWRLIETAPKDGTCVIVGVAGVPRSVGEAYWWQNEQGRGGWQTWDGENRRRTVYDPGPTHWQPLPEPPAPQPKDGEA